MGVLLEGQDSKSCSVRGQIQAHFELKDDVIQKVDTPNVLILIVVSCLFFFFFSFIFIVDICNMGHRISAHGVSVFLFFF
jgi:hypothetical protein